MSKRIDDVSFSLEVNIKEAYVEVRRLTTLVFRMLDVAQRMSGSPELDVFIAKAQRLISILNQARLTIMAFQIAAGPIGWGLAIVGLVGTTLTIAEEMDAAQPIY